MTPTEEVRNFRRYAKSLGLILKFKERPIKAETVNYSLQGLGVLLEGRPPIKKGDILHIGQIELGNAGDASVAWMKPEEDTTLVGFSLIRPIDGCFRHFRFADIVSGFRKGKKTGTFALSDGSGKKVFVKGGELIFATSEEHEDNLDMFLIRKGRLTEEQYCRAVEERMATGGSRAAALVRLGYLKPAELMEVVKMQAEDIIAGIFSCEECCFTFEDGMLPDKDLVTMKLPAANLIYRGLKETNNRQILEQYSPSIDNVIRFAASQEEFWAVSLDEEDRKILTLVDGKRRLGEILRLSPFGDKATLQSICALLGAGVVEAGDFNATPGNVEPLVGVSKETEAPLGREKAMLKFKEGKRNMAIGHLDLAVSFFEEAVSLDPSESKYHLHKGIALRRLGRNEEAEEAFSKALKLDPANREIIDELNRLRGMGR